MVGGIMSDVFYEMSIRNLRHSSLQSNVFDISEKCQYPVYNIM